MGIIIEPWGFHKPDNRDVAEGESVRLTCRFQPSLMSSSTVYFWSRTSRGVRENAAIKGDSFDPRYSVDFSADEGKYDILISQAQYDPDNGIFECWLKEKGSGLDIYHKSYSVTVLVPPGQPIINPAKPLATENEPLTLTCSSTGGSPDPVIQWFKDGNTIPGQLQKGGSMLQPTVNKLTIYPTVEDDNAVYQCSAWNRAIQKDNTPEANAPRVSVGSHHPMSVLVDTDAVLQCHVTANPPTQKVRWFRGNQLLSTSFNHTIPAVTLEDEGVYKCVADNGVGGPQEAELRLTVIEEKEVDEGDDVEIMCEVKSSPPAIQIFWVKKGEAHYQENGAILRLNRITAQQSGTYTCRALTVLHPTGKPSQMEVSGNASVEIHVKHAPGETSITPAMATAIAGRPYTLQCDASPHGWPRPDYRWWKEGAERKEITRRQNLSLPVVSLEHEGRFFCQPENSLGKGTVTSVYLTVNEPLTMMVNLPPRVVKKEETMDYTITCQARGKPEPRVRWLKDGVDLSDTSGLYIKVDSNTLESNGVHIVQSTLKFSGASRRSNRLSYADRGRYVCQFDNGLDEMTRSEMLLQVEHSPIVQHTYNRVAYDPGETAMLQCKMQAYPMPSFEWYMNNRILDNFGNHQQNMSDNGADLYTATLVVKRVAEHDYGDYTCKASNQVGDSKKTIIKLVKKSSPDRPMHLEVVDVHWDRVTLKWAEGFNGGFSNTEYLVTYTNMESGQSRNESCRSRNLCEITGLNSKTEYKMKVVAVNSRGYSDYSDEIHVSTKDMPRAVEAKYDELSSYVFFTMEPTNINLVAKIEARQPGTDWQIMAVVPALVGEAYLPPPANKPYTDVRVTLCLKANDSWCGNEKLASFTNGLESQSPDPYGTTGDNWTKGYSGPYEDSNNFYYPPSNYHQLNEEEVHTRQPPNSSDYLSAPYYDVSGLPDPYAPDEDKQPHPPHVSFDESLESGYSTPNSRNRRVIREIIV
ncbi:igcm-1 [Cordylochernes scorpioides]|uniref:Igcm-1 n=1 Tax=Cordylochernes scorpioides TaxID=51811 RepID=A0ABY6KS93_9ARAC|nr:igcm-1 [Cordylochernes scorpioides]